MNRKILGIHHVTAISGPAHENFKFYTETLGLRLVKRTVNFDDPASIISTTETKPALPAP